MYPVIRCGALVDIVKVDSSELSVNDICAYFWRGQLKVHRLKQKANHHALFGSDRGLDPLQRIDLERVLGKIDKIYNPCFLDMVRRKVLEYVRQDR